MTTTRPAEPTASAERRRALRSHRPSAYVRAFGALLAASGVVTVGGASGIARVTASSRRGVPDPRIVRVLGARQVAQGALVIAAPDPAITGLGVGADAAHALSMVALAAASSRFRRPALLSATMAGTSAALGAVLVRWQRADPR